MDTTEKDEQQFIDDIKASISGTTLKISEQVIKSAYVHLNKQECFNLAKDDVIKSFFINKIPTVLSKEISKELHTILGLDLEL